MLFLAQPSLALDEVTDLPALIDESFQSVRSQFGGRPTLEVKCEISNPAVRCDRHSLKHALGEILANAIQANTEDPSVSVRLVNGVKDADFPGVFRQRGRFHDRNRRPGLRTVFHHPKYRGRAGIDRGPPDHRRTPRG